MVGDDVNTHPTPRLLSTPRLLLLGLPRLTTPPHSSTNHRSRRRISVQRQWTSSSLESATASRALRGA